MLDDFQEERKILSTIRHLCRSQNKFRGTHRNRSQPIGSRRTRRFVLTCLLDNSRKRNLKKKQTSRYCDRLRVPKRKRERSIAVIKVLIAPSVADKKRFRRLLSLELSRYARWQTYEVATEGRLIGRRVTPGLKPPLKINDAFFATEVNCGDIDRSIDRDRS